MTPRSKPEWKVEWVDSEGLGHVDEFNDLTQAREFYKVMHESGMCMMLDCYTRNISEWVRG